MLEGDLWVYARTDLGDFYRGDLTLRQLWVRFKALPTEAAIWNALRDEQERADAEQRRRDLDDVLAMVGGLHA